MGQKHGIDIEFDKCDPVELELQPSHVLEAARAPWKTDCQVWAETLMYHQQYHLGLLDLLSKSFPIHNTVHINIISWIIKDRG